MPERWEQKLKSLRRLEMSPEHVWALIEEGPRPERPTPVRTRILAGVVATAIVAAGGALAWNAFGPRNGTTSGVSSTSRIGATLHGVSLVYPASWTLVDLWPLAGDIASWPEPGSVIDVPEGTPERGGLPVLQLSNRDLGLGSACGTEVNGDSTVLYVAANGGPYLIDAQGHPRWPATLTRADGPCGPGWYAYRESWLDTGNGSGEARPYLVYAAFGPDVPQADRDEVFAAFSSLSLAPATDFLYPPAETSPTYVQGSALNDQPSVVEPTSSPTGDLSGTVLVPDVLGLQRVEAKRMLEDLGLEPIVDPAGEPSDDVVKGQSPVPGTAVGPGTTVIITVGCFPAPCPSSVNGETIYDPCSCSTRR